MRTVLPCWLAQPMPARWAFRPAGPLTLVFRLSEKDDNFLAKLTLPGAMPCDEAFFESTRGTYGLTAKTTLSSGSFYLYNWTASGLFLRRDVSSPMIGSLRLVQNTGSTGKSAAQLIADEKCSAALDDTGEDTSLQSVDYSDTTWALLFNSAEDSVFAESGTAAGACRHRPGECGCALFRSVHRCRGSCAHRPFRGRHRLPQVCREPAAHHHRPRVHCT